MHPSVDEVKFKAMGSDCRIVVNASPDMGLAQWAVDRLETLESLWSRFRPTSEISRLNISGSLTVSPETFNLVAHAIEAWSLTGGLFDPTVLLDLERAGYDRTHKELAVAAGAPRQRSAVDEKRRRNSLCGEIDLRPEIMAIRLPSGTAFDPGGIGKGLAADMVATELMALGAAGAMVELGGDVRVIGDHPHNGRVWGVEVVGLNQTRSIGLIDGGIATSSQAIRRWTTPTGLERHHLIDPATGTSSDSPVATAVVAGSSAWRAEVVAKAAVVAGFERGNELIRAQKLSGSLFGFDDEVADAGLFADASISV